MTDMKIDKHAPQYGHDDKKNLSFLEFFSDVRLESLPVDEENDQQLFRTAYSVTQTSHHNYGNHIEGVVLVTLDEEAREVRQIHLFKSMWF
jgi:hypothetical protein